MEGGGRGRPSSFNGSGGEIRSMMWMLADSIPHLFALDLKRNMEKPFRPNFLA